MPPQAKFQSQRPSQKFPYQTVLKIDAVTHEAIILKGGQRPLQEARPTSWCEVWLATAMKLRSCCTRTSIKCSEPKSFPTSPSIARGSTVWRLRRIP